MTKSILKNKIDLIDQENKISLKTIDILTNWMDTKFRIPGTQIRFGLDPVLSLLPGVGDVLSTGVSVLIFALILGKGVPFITAVRMMGNIILDFIFSAVPVIGTIADVGYKSNVKNLNLLEKHLNNNPSGKYHYGIWIVFILTIVIIIALVIYLFYLLGLLLNWINPA